jgi:transglutaminase-like putative cysteine protease/uncharacterized alpha-E superfamily protein
MASIYNLRRNLRQARPVAPREVWELSNELWASLKNSEAEVHTRNERVRWLRTVVDECHRINGVLLGTMRRDEALSFFRIGQQLERASMTCRVLAARANNATATSGEDLYLDAHHRAILRSLASYQPFRRATPTGRDAGVLVEFLLRDQYLPRSVNTCLTELRDLVKTLPGSEAVLERCTDASVAVAAAPTMELGPIGLKSFLIVLQSAIANLHDEVSGSYFLPAPVPERPASPMGNGAVHPAPPGLVLAGRSPNVIGNPGTIREMEGADVDGRRGMTCRVTHLTTYEYDGPVEHAYNEAHLRPRTENGQRCLSHELEVTPEPVACSETVDPFGNRVTIFSVRGGFTVLSVKATSEVVTATPLPAPSGPPWESVCMMLDVDRKAAGREARRYRAPSRLVPADDVFAEYAKAAFQPSRPVLESASDLTSRIYREFAYEPGATSVTTPLLEVFEHRRGVCQDFAHLMIACVRSIGLAARYVSGYIETPPPSERDALVGSNASHAWAAVYLPGWGWVDFDPTNNQTATSSYVTTAWGRDYWDVSPLRGSVEGGGGSHRLHVSVEVERINEEAEGRALQA